MLLRFCLLASSASVGLMLRPSPRHAWTTRRGAPVRSVAERQATNLEQLLALEGERRELQARLAANMERQRALAIGADVEDAPPRVAEDARDDPVSMTCAKSP